MSTLTQILDTGLDFTGLAGAGLFTFDGLPGVVPTSVIRIKAISWDINGTTPTFNEGVWDVIDRTEGVMPYDAQTGNFTVPGLITGGTSLATATGAFDEDLGATGALFFTNIDGTFQDNELITDAGVGSATSNCPLVTTIAAGTRFTRRNIVPGECSLLFHQTFTDDELILERQASGGLLQALRLVTDGIALGFGVASVQFDVMLPNGVVRTPG